MKLDEIVTFEEECQQEWKDDLLFEMANIHERTHGIPDVVIWVGIANKQHGLRIKISNKKNKFDPRDHWVMMMPTLDYDDRRVADWITPNHITAIKQWVKLNQPLLYAYEQGEIDDTVEFLQQISSVK
jgi:hypothetical protein